MAVTFDAATGATTGAQTNDAATITWSHTCGASATYLSVGIAAGGTTAATGTMTATYNGVAMTLVGSVRSNNAGGGSGKVYLFELKNPATGAHNVVCTSSATATLSGGSISFNGSGGSTLAPAVASGTDGGSNPPAVTVGGTAATSMVVSVCCDGSSLGGSSQTQRWLENGNNGSSAGNAQGSTAPGGGNVTFTETDNFLDDWGIVAVEVLATATIGAEVPIRVARQAVARSYSF